MKKQIVDKLYAVLGTDSGILLGIKERPIVEVIVQFAIDEMSKQHIVMKSEDTLQGRYNAIITEAHDQIRKLSDGKLIDLEDDGFEDEAGNDIDSVDAENVYFNGHSYPISELGFYDALNLIDTISRNNLTPDL